MVFLTDGWSLDILAPAIVGTVARFIKALFAQVIQDSCYWLRARMTLKSHMNKHQGH